MALEVKDDLFKSFILDGTEYYIRRNPNGYGIEIMSKKTDKDGKLSFETYFRTTSKDQIDELFNSIVEAEKLPDTLPEPIIEDQSKIFVYHDKYGTFYYYIPTIEALDKVGRKILKERFIDGYYNYVNDDNSPNDTGFNSIEEILALPDGSVKNDLVKKWDRIECDSIEFKEGNKKYKEVEAILEGKGKVGNVLRCLEFFEYDNYSIEDLIIV